MIEIQNLTKRFSSANGDITALQDINLTVNDGEIFGIIGLSGAGKSTLVRCINLLEKPTEGSVIVDGQDLTKMKTKDLLQMRRSIGMIFQSFNLLEQRNVIGNICYPMEIAGIPKAEALKRANELLEVVGLTDRAKSYPSQLSGGQKQRVAIARALSTNPKYLLCDEATSALDPNTTQQILDLLKQINQTRGVTIIVITHEMRVIEQICNRVAVIDKSHIVEVGNVADVFANPQSEMGKELVLPKSSSHSQKLGVKGLRIVFDGTSTYEPIISDLIVKCNVAVNILVANVNTLNGVQVGQMVIQLPENDTEIKSICSYLDSKNIQYQVEDV